MKKVVLFCFVISILCGYSCIHDAPVPIAPTLPPITQTGENTFGCMVNGEVWLPKAGWMDFTPYGYWDRGYVSIVANRSGRDPYTSFQFFVGPVYGDTLIQLHYYSDSTGMQHVRYYAGYNSNSTAQEYYPISINSGELHLLRVDTINNIVSGTFHFVGVDTLNGDSVVIENGRFDFGPR